MAEQRQVKVESLGRESQVATGLVFWVAFQAESRRGQQQGLVEVG